MATATKSNKKPTQKQPGPAKDEERNQEDRGYLIEVIGVIIAGLGIAALYFAIVGGGNPVDNIIRGLGGSFCILIPVLLLWISFLTIFTRRFKKNGRKIALIALMFLLVMAARHVFSAEDIKYSLHIRNYSSFIVRSYEMKAGGGAMGALLGYPVYELFGKWGGFIILLMLIIADLVLMRVISIRKIGVKVKEMVSESAQEYRQHREEHLRERELAEQERLRLQEAERPEFYIEEITPILPPESAGKSDIPEHMKRGRAKKTEAPVESANTGDESAIEVPASDSGFMSDMDALEPPFDLDEPAEKGQEDKKRPARKKKEEPAPEEPPTRLDSTPLILPKHKGTGEDPAYGDYNFPPVDLLASGRPVENARNMVQRDREKALKLEETLKSFGISAKLTGIAHGPAITRFELAPAPGIKVSRISSLADDIAMNLEALSVRIEAPIPGKAAVGVEIPNDEVEIVPLRDVLESPDARRNPSRLTVALGKDNSGKYIIADLAKMPHLLIAGATGSGKSVCINCIVCSILYRASPDEVRMIMIDPKVVELSVYNEIPHLLIPVVTDPKKASGALSWAVAEMSDRYKKFAERGVRDMKGYNLSCTMDEKPLPYIVIIIDELADLMATTPGEVEDAIFRLAQLARAAGIHLVIATQRPSVNVITGVIKANIPSRIAFTVASQIDSRTILDIGGAEKLLGRGDMLYAPSGTTKPQRVQGAWLSDDEIHSIVGFIKDRHDPEYNDEVIEHINTRAESIEEESSSSDGDEQGDALLPQAIEIAVESGQASISMLQRRLRVGYARAGRLIDDMAARGIISQAEGAKPRNVLITREQYNVMYDKQSGGIE